MQYTYYTIGHCPCSCTLDVTSDGAAVRSMVRSPRVRPR